jgi:methionyl-tRNA synthetase
MYLITTPIPYVNSRPHLGTVLEPVVNDCIARFQRRLGETVIFTTGADQHGLKIYNTALAEGKEPQEYADEITASYTELLETLEISSQHFTPTSSPEHKAVAQLVWQKLAAKNLIYKQSYSGLYCQGCEDFYAPSQLDEQGNCPIHKSKPIEMTEENYFFKLSAFEKVITEYLQSAHIVPASTAQEWLNFIAEGVRDISISREAIRLPWGVQVPGDESQVMYVWFEALINYITACVNPAVLERIKEVPEMAGEIVAEMWEDLSEDFPIGFMYCGSDIAKFHCVVWIGMLAGLDLALPKTFQTHGMINDSQGNKFSKSLGNGTYPEEVIAKLNGPEGLRFVLLHEINTIGDTNFSWPQVIEAYNANLADNLGNLVVRVSNLIEKLLDGVIAEDTTNAFTIDTQDVYRYLADFNPPRAFRELFAQSSRVNQYLEQTQPWKLAKDPSKKAEVLNILTDCAAAVVELGKVLALFLPASGQGIVEVFEAATIQKAPILFPKVEAEDNN